MALAARNIGPNPFSSQAMAQTMHDITRRDGREIHSPDPSFDPRTPGDNDWRRVR